MVIIIFCSDIDYHYLLRWYWLSFSLLSINLLIVLRDRLYLPVVEVRCLKFFLSARHWVFTDTVWPGDQEEEGQAQAAIRFSEKRIIKLGRWRHLGDELAVAIDTNGTIETMHYAGQSLGIIDPDRQGDGLSGAINTERNIAEKRQCSEQPIHGFEASKRRFEK